MAKFSGGKHLKADGSALKPKAPAGAGKFAGKTDGNSGTKGYTPPNASAGTVKPNSKSGGSIHPGSHEAFLGMDHGDKYDHNPKRGGC